ncbi:hypothetical protein GWI33_018412 [Rhynchophorus ferrugineus]|uniref:Uncharacterized protein n=1 Tax=Rhynchophorus ferrugineus TaxID=354439 RepID=A0A834I0E7_RHYFE|nr:hypothetical protein GWI33_018412 [Rhynchophorus ferrugineus]
MKRARTISFSRINEGYFRKDPCRELSGQCLINLSSQTGRRAEQEAKSSEVAASSANASWNGREHSPLLCAVPAKNIFAYANLSYGTYILKASTLKVHMWQQRNASECASLTSTSSASRITCTCAFVVVQCTRLRFPAYQVQQV